MNSRMILLAVEERLLRARYGVICTDDAVREIGQLLNCNPFETERTLSYDPPNHTAGGTGGDK